MEEACGGGQGITKGCGAKGRRRRRRRRRKVHYRVQKSLPPPHSLVFNLN
jgi:hypothetical protein